LLISRHNSIASDFLRILTAIMTQEVKIIAAESVHLSHMN